MKKAVFVFLFTVGWLTLLPVFADDFTRVDELMAQMPAARSIGDISDYILQQDFTDMEKARAVFDWITAHIAYDTDSFFSGRIGATDAASVFKTGKSVCQGYSELFMEISTRAGLEAVMISGYAKGYGYKPGDRISGSNHAWNAVKMDNRWVLIDSTWGAGSVNGRNFERNYEPFWFDTQPELFILHHLPEDSRWQLLNPVISASQYAKARFVETYYLSVLYKMGFSPERIVETLKNTTLPKAFFYPEDPILVIEAPLTGILAKGTPYRFVFESEKDVKMMFGTSSSRIDGYVRRVGNQYILEITPKGDILEFYASVTFKGQKNNWQVLSYKCQ